jgi:predicted metal-dependent RNase
LSESWEKSYDILNEANNKISKNNKFVKEILKKPNLSKEDHKKIKELLEAEADIRNKAIEQVEKIHREKTKNFEQEWTDS